MNKTSKMVIVAVVLLTIASIGTWQATGGDWYTKYEVIEQVKSKPDPNDPLTAAGFYDGGSTSQTVTKNEFRFGLLPTPAGIFDKHALSVASVAGPVWLIGFGFIWFQRRRNSIRQG